MTKTLSRILLLILSACALHACTIRKQLLEVQGDIDDLRVEIGEMNKSIISLKEILTEVWNGGLLTGVETVTEDGVETGYTLTFYDGRAITIRQGIDGHSPVIGVALDDYSVWCWTLDGQWLLDGEGHRIPAAAENGKDGIDGITPQLKIVDEYWYISTDNGKTWTRLERAQGLDAVNVFTGIDTSSESYVEVFLAAGGSIRIPRYIPLSLELDIPEEDTGLSPGETREFRYVLSGRITEDTVVTAGTDGKYTLTIQRTSQDSGIIAVTCPQEFHQGFVYILVNDGEGHSVVRVINFYERMIRVSGDFSFWVDCNGGTINIPLRYNFPFTLESDVDWLHPVQTKAEMKDGEIVISVDPNQTRYVRTGHIMVHPVDHPEFVVETFTIEEASAYFSISQTSLTVESAGGQYYISIQSSRGVSFRSSANWVHCGLNEDGNYYWTLNVSIDKNVNDSSRETSINIYTGDGSTLLGTISVKQLAYTVDHEKDFIIRIRAAAVYDYTVYLPLFNWVDCVVDWGDGSVETVRRYVYSDSPVYHQYNISEPESFSISISGQVTSISMNSVPAADTILAVEQWGNLNVSDVSFSGCVRLSSVPDDKMGFFANVWSLNSLFNDCKSLQSIPEGLFDYAEHVTSLYRPFSNTGISSISAGLLKGMKYLTNVNSLFSGLTNLKSIPEDIFSNCPNAANITSFSGIFSGSGLESIPPKLFSACINATDFGSAFSDTPITDIPAGLFANNKMIRSVSWAFSGCNRLQSIPVSIFDENRRITDFSYVFYWNYPDLQKQESPYTMIDGKKVHLYERENYPDDFVGPMSYYGALRAFYNHNWGLESIPSGWY